jgi:hypothetical protein
MTKPYLEPFNFDEPITIIPYPNGGVTVEQRAPEIGVVEKKLGAFSSLNDALDALRGPETDQ